MSGDEANTPWFPANMSSTIIDFVSFPIDLFSFSFKIENPDGTK